MKIRKFTAFLLAVVMMFLLAGCKNENKDNTSEAADNYNKNAKYDTLANIKSNTPETFKKETEHVVFDGPVLVPNADECYNLTLEKSTAYDDRRDELIKTFIDNYSSEYEEVNICAGDQKEDMYRSSEQVLYTYIGGFGYLPANANDVFYGFYPWVERVRLYRGETPSDTEYLMYDDKKFSLSAAQVQLQNYLDNFLKEYEPDYDFVIRTAFVRQLDDIGDGNHYIFDFTVNRTYQGVNIDPKAYAAINTELAGGVTRFGNSVNFVISSANGFKTWSHMFGARIYSVKNKTPLPDKFITFESALELLSKKVTAIDKINLDCAELCYVSSYDGSESIKDMEGKIDEYHANLVWTFTSPLTGRDLPEKSIKEGHELQRVYVVNAVTGSVHMYHDVVQY